MAAPGQFSPQSTQDPLALSGAWGDQPSDQIDQAPLVSLDEALEASWLRRGISREAFLGELLSGVHQRRLVPLLAMLPRRWRQGPAALPGHLRGLGTLLEGGLVTPLLLAALVDDLHHLLPKASDSESRTETTSALTLWASTSVPGGQGHQALPRSLQDWRDLTSQSSEATTSETPRPSPVTPTWRGLGAGVVWHNQGLRPLQAATTRWGNTLLAQIFNALGANGLPAPWANRAGRSDRFCFEGRTTTRELVHWLEDQGWHCRARIRASVASFGLGASCAEIHGQQGWRQIPLALPYRTGLLQENGKELESLLPHCSLELELTPPNGGAANLLQYYQGTEGLNGWAALNDLHRPWQNDRQNGTVVYPGACMEGALLGQALDLCDLMAAVHNSAAASGHLRTGGYGALGFCIDSTALLEQALFGRSHLFPLTLGGIWRERLHKQLEQLLSDGLRLQPEGDACIERYRQALDTLPSDLVLHGAHCTPAMERLRASQPRHSPFCLVRRLNGEE